MERKEIIYLPIANAYSGIATLYNRFLLRQKQKTIHEIFGICGSTKIQVARKFLIDAKYCKLRSENLHVFNADELDEEFFKLAGAISGKRWHVWKKALEMLESRKDRRKVLEYLQPVAVAAKLMES